QTLESGAIDQARSGTPQILVNHGDSLKPQLACPVLQTILAPLAFEVMSHLGGRGLANVDDGRSEKTFRRELRLIHCPLRLPAFRGFCAALTSSSTSARASSFCWSPGTAVIAAGSRKRQIHLPLKWHGRSFHLLPPCQIGNRR